VSKADDDVLLEAKKRFKSCETWESSARVNFREDVRFANGDHINNYQWPQEIANSRTKQNKPIITVNLIRQHCLNVLNASRQNPPQIEIRPTGGGATFKSAEIYESICRHIESNSNAQQAYDCASQAQIQGGIGYFRVVTGYADEDSFDQEIFIKRVPDPLSVYLDPHLQQFDGSDSRYGFVFSDMDREQFEAEYPKYKDMVGLPALAESAVYRADGEWIGKDRVRVAEYYRRVTDTDTLHHMSNGETVNERDVTDDDLMAAVRADSVRKREVTTAKIEHFLIAGNAIVERSDWAGRYIPIIRVIGEETVIDGQLDRKGLTRNIVSSQQTYNYYTSAGIEYVALQSKTPWVAPVAAIEGYENEWAQANVVNLAILPYNHKSDDNQEIPAPSREQPPVFAPAYLDGTRLSAQEMESASGQPEATFGQPSNERSGKAVDARTRNASTSTYHFVNNMAIAIQYLGKILIDLIPKIYDTQRVLKIIAEDGTPTAIQIDPNAPQAHAPMPAPDPEMLDAQAVSAIFNPSVGRYSVVASVGPSYETKRQETFNAISQLIAEDSALAPIVGDLLFRNSDFAGADIIADRLARMVPAQALGKGPDPQVVQLQQLLAQQHQVMQTMGQELQAAKSKQLDNDQQKDIDVYKSQTSRIEAIGKIDPEAFKPVIREMISQLLGTPVNAVINAHMQEQAMMEQAAAQVGQPQAPQPPQGQPPTQPQ
jgi:Phage P22-like portal protein